MERPDGARICAMVSCARRVPGESVRWADYPRAGHAAGRTRQIAFPAGRAEFTGDVEEWPADRFLIHAQPGGRDFEWVRCIARRLCRPRASQRCLLESSRG